MSDVRFILKEPNGNKDTLIYLIYRFNYNRLKYSTGEFVNPALWVTDEKTGKQRVTVPKKLPKPKREELKAINTQLNRYDAEVNSILTDFKKQEIQPTVELIRIELDKKFKKRDNYGNKPDLLSFIEGYIKEVKTVFRNRKPVTINERTKQKYNTTLKFLKEFAGSKGKQKINFSDIDKQFYLDFVDYLQTTCNHKDNTRGKYIANLKTFLSIAQSKGHIIKIDYSKVFIKPSEEVEKIYLTETELMKLYELDLTKNKKLESVRDLFLIGCYTALRYSDYTNIKPENIYTNDNGTFIKISTFKTGKQVIIPLHWIVAEILKKYNNDLPPAISNQKMNDYLKELGENAKIDSLYEVYKMKNGLKVKTTVKKYELISTHTARRTGATNMYKNKIPVPSIMFITGHKTEKAFMLYLRFTDEDNANLLVDNPFFSQKKSNLKVVNK